MPSLQTDCAEGPAGCHPIGHLLRSLAQALEELEKGVLFALDPLARNGFPGGIDDLSGVRYNLADPRLEIIQRTNPVMELAARVKTLQGRIGRIPVGAVPGGPMVDHTRHETGFAGCPT